MNYLYIALLDNFRFMDSCCTGNLRSATSRFHKPQLVRTVMQSSGDEEEEEVIQQVGYDGLLPLDAEWPR